MPTQNSAVTDLTITDPDGDQISIEKSYRPTPDCVAFIQIHQGDEAAAVVLPQKEALAVAGKLIEMAGCNVVPVSDLKLASDLTFNEAVLRVAAAHKRTVTFRYAKDDGEYIEARRLNPEKIVGEGDNLAALGTDPDRGSPRRFRLDRIKGEVSFA